jgi:hypothetical protein
LSLSHSRRAGIAGFILFSVMIWIVNCAKQGFPPGGPEDKTPPFVMRTEPGRGALRVPPGREVRVWFSEAVRASISNDAVFISPNPGAGVRLKWSGARLAIRFPEPFPDSAAVVVTLGTGIQDMRGNAMKSSFTLAFTRGAVLDSGIISGRAVGSGSALGLDVWAYRIAGGDVIDPAKTEPEYAVQCQENGVFSLSHLPQGLYRVFAVRDRARDRLYQPVEDEIGVACRDAELSVLSGNTDSLFFRMSREDTLGPALLRAMSPHSGEMVLQFSEPVTMAVPPRLDAPDDTTAGKAYVDPSDPRKIVLLTKPQVSRKSYSIDLAGVCDARGNPPDSASRRARIDGSALADTASPRLLSVYPKEGERSVPLDACLRLVFSAAVDSVSVRNAVSVRNEAGEEVPFRAAWESPASMNLIPDQPLSSRSRYSLAVDSSVTGRSGRFMKDTTMTFHTLDADTLSEISGTIGQVSRTGGRLMMEARQIGRDSTVYRRTLEGPGPYRFKGVLPGRYLLQGYCDADGNGRYDFGRPHPFEPSEAFSVSLDTILVRSRWPNEGNDMVLP